MTQEELVEWLKEYRLNLMSLMGQDLFKLADVLDKCGSYFKVHPTRRPTRIQHV